jgi:pyridoxamine 5'-phosphate oxidase
MQPAQGAVSQAPFLKEAEMSKALKENIAPYVQGIPFGVLAYVRANGTPVQRSLGSFALEDADVYFSTREEAAKVKDLEARPQASFFLEADGQQLAQWKNILFIGKAENLTDQADLDKAVATLGARNPRFKERIEKNGLTGTRIFRLRTNAVELVDYAKGFGFSQTISISEKEHV